MRVNTIYKAGLLLTIILVLVVSFIPFLNAEESQFRKQFIENYNTNSLQAQTFLIKKNKDIIEAEVNSLLTEAMATDKSYQDRMYLLDIAAMIATMNIHWNNGSEELLKKVETLQKAELKKEQAKTAEAEKLKEAEKVPGNFVMATHNEEMSKKGLAPVIYPHWIHRAFFRCKVCHEDIFVMKRNANNISQANIQEGKQCGVCHNGAISFNAGTQENCSKCHIFGKPESKPLMDLSYYSHDKFKEIASRAGSEWKPENLPGSKLPLDKLGFINWIELDKTKAFNPRTSLGQSSDAEGIRETNILFQTPNSFLKDVLFSHKIHSTWVKCSLCHPNIFKPELGANKVTMIEMKDGKSCGRCHGRVSFTYADCLRCHSQAKDKPPEGALINKAGQPVQPQ